MPSSASKAHRDPPTHLEDTSPRSESFDLLEKRSTAATHGSDVPDTSVTLTHPLTGCSKDDPTLGCSAAESALRRYLMHHPILFDPKNPHGLMRQFGGTVRAQCLIHWMLHSDQIWFDGVLLPSDQAQYLYQLSEHNTLSGAEPIHENHPQMFQTIEKAQNNPHHAFVPLHHASSPQTFTHPHVQRSDPKETSTKASAHKKANSTDGINTPHRAKSPPAHTFTPPDSRNYWYSSDFFIDFFSPIHWQDPLDILGEQTEEDFLNNNLAARAFAHALTQQLAHLQLSEHVSEHIISQAVHQMYPKYAQQVHSMVGHLVHHAFYKHQVKVRSFGTINPNSPLMNVPTNLRPDFLALVLETIDLVRSATGVGLEIGQKEQLDRSKKSIEKVYKALKKYYAPTYPRFFDPLLEAHQKALERAQHLHYRLSVKALELLDARFVHDPSFLHHVPTSRNEPPNG